MFEKKMHMMPLFILLYITFMFLHYFIDEQLRNLGKFTQLFPILYVK